MGATIGGERLREVNTHDPTTRVLDSDTPASRVYPCPWCDYDLRGIASERCPECARQVGQRGASFSSVPWEHRDLLGRFHALRRTCGKVAFTPAQFTADAIASTASVRSASRFAIMISLLAAMPAMTFVALFRPGLSIGDFESPRGLLFGGTLSNATRLNLLSAELLHCVIRGGLIWPIPFVAIGLFAVLATRAPTVFFRRGECLAATSDRLAAIAFYTTAPLALSGLIVINLLAIALLRWAFPWEIAWLHWLLSAAVVEEAIVIGWYASSLARTYIATSSRSGTRSGTRLILPAVTLAGYWFGLGLLCLVVLPGAVGFVIEIVRSY